LHNYISKNKIMRIKKIIYNIFNFTYDIKKYKYDKKLSTIQIKMKIKIKIYKIFFKRL
jgi:methyl coenzyme M reductase subunit D